MPVSAEEEFNDLCFYTLSHPGKSFIHQHIVDAFTAQTAIATTKAISIIFSLAGLYLYIENNLTGKEVQLFHMQMAKRKRTWPNIIQPKNRGHITVKDVLAAVPGDARDYMIRKWCSCVWDSYRDNHKAITVLVQSEFLRLPFPKKK